MINAEVEKGATENAISLVRRFTKRVQGAGILPRLRKIRYNTRPQSKFIVKKKRLASIKKKAHYEELVKLGKIAERTTPYRRKR